VTRGFSVTTRSSRRVTLRRRSGVSSRRLSTPWRRRTFPTSRTCRRRATPSCSPPARDAFPS